MTKVLIYGGRDWNNQVVLNRVLDDLHAQHKFTIVINGGQISRVKLGHVDAFVMPSELKPGDVLFGADYQADVWATAARLKVWRFYANWTFGKIAGPYRNRRMLLEGRPALGVEFPGAKGTRNMRALLDKARVPVIEAASVIKAWETANGSG